MAEEEALDVWHHQQVELCGPKLDHPMATGGASVSLRDGRILLVYSGPVNPHNKAPGTCRTYARTSSDGGRTWSDEREIVYHPECQACGGPLMRDRDGVLWLTYMAFHASVWDKATNEPDMAKTRSDLWATRSFDEGETWVDNQMIFRGYTGATLDVKQTSSGCIVVPFSYVVPNPGRLVSTSVVSADNGGSWQLGSAIDIGQNGDHAGAIEPVVVELQDGRLWMLIRTNLGHFLQAFSQDDGLTWSDPKPTQITSPSAPCHVVRLASRRLALVWNNLPPTAPAPRQALSMALSEDDGRTWTQPLECVRAVEENRPETSYPFINEVSPGEMLVGFNHVLKGWHGVQANAFRIRERTLLGA